MPKHPARPRDPGGLLSHAHAEIFQVLGVNASIVSYEPEWKITDSPQWRVLHVEPSVLPFEIEHGVEASRYHYNSQRLEQAERTRRSVLGRYGGLADFFVPLVREQTSRGVLVVGPFAMSRPTSAEVLQRWRRITGRQGHLTDAEFAHYVSMTLSTLVLSPAQVETLRRFLASIAALIAGEGSAAAELAKADALRPELERARLDEHVWEAAHSMINEQTGRSWQSYHRRGDLQSLGMSATPDHVVVGLLASAEANLDPVDRVLNRNAFQRACVELARARGGVISGQVGDHGVTFLSRTGTKHSQHDRVLNLAGKAAALAKSRFGMQLHLGSSSLPRSAALSDHYEAALAAAESALSRKLALVREPSARLGHGAAIGQLRQELGALAETEPEKLGTSFDRYIELVASRSGYRLETARAHLEAGFDGIARALLAGGVLDARSMEQAYQELDRAERSVRTVAELFVVYRRAVADLSQVAEHPRSADRDFRVRRALRYLESHYDEPLTLARVAKLSGLTWTHFSRLFRRQQRTPFAVYLRRLRVERAKRLLSNTSLEVKRIAQACGFTSQHYFARSFRSVTGTTPLGWRRTGGGRSSKRANKKS
jgi:AraC-like DNA-binding protein